MQPNWMHNYFQSSPAASKAHTWLALLETVSKPLFCQAFAILYATANKNSVRQKQSAISLLRDIKFNGSAEQLALDFVDASTAMFHSGVSMNDIILHEFAQIVYQRNKIGGSAINEALLKHAALKANKPDTPELNVYDFIQEHTALISTNLEVQTRINLAEAYIADATDSRPPKCARCQKMHPNATAEISTTKCWAHTDVHGNILPPHLFLVLVITTYIESKMILIMSNLEHKLRVYEEIKSESSMK